MREPETAEEPEWKGEGAESDPLQEQRVGMCLEPTLSFEWLLSKSLSRERVD